MEKNGKQVNVRYVLYNNLELESETYNKLIYQPPTAWLVQASHRLISFVILSFAHPHFVLCSAATDPMKSTCASPSLKVWFLTHAHACLSSPAINASQPRRGRHNKDGKQGEHHKNNRKD